MSGSASVAPASASARTAPAVPRALRHTGHSGVGAGLALPVRITAPTPVPQLPRPRRPTVRLLSWNVAKRKNVIAQSAAIAATRADIVVLQELNTRTWPLHREALGAAGLTHHACARDGHTAAGDLARSLPCFVAIASRWPLRSTKPARVPTRDVVVSVVVDSPYGIFEVHGLHVPTYTRPDRVLKVETQEAMHRRLSAAKLPALLCGDFNSPFAESSDGTVIPFARGRGTRQRDAEAALMGLTNASGLTDLFRHSHGYDIDGHSWYWKNRGKTGGYRLDHIFASANFNIRRCDYIHEWRISGLSDHSAIYADIQLRNV